MQHKYSTPFFLGILLLFVSSACVRKKFFRAEQKARSAAEARELVLIRELGDRKIEADKLITEVGSLNREIGQLERQISDLTAQADLKSQQFGASSNELRTKLAQTQMKLEETQELLKKQQAALAEIETSKQKKQDKLLQLHKELSEALIPWLNQGVELELQEQQVAVNLPNILLFDKKGLSLRPTGRTLLLGLSNYITKKPQLRIQVEAHTDYDFPDSMEDSWAWSAHRSQLICRTLVREYNVNGNQLIPVCRGEYSPVASNETIEGKELNRRTVLQVRY